MRVAVRTIVAALFLAALSQPAFAQQSPGSGQGPAMQEGSGKEITPQQFSEMKTRILKMIEERQTRLTQEKACVEAATSGAELKKCRPDRPMGQGGPGGPGGQFPGGPGQGQQR